MRLALSKQSLLERHQRTSRENPGGTEEAEMCPVCVSTITLIAAGVGAAGGLAGIIAGKTRGRRVASVHTEDAPSLLPANEETIQ